MIILIGGASHTGKTNLAQKLLEISVPLFIDRSFKDGLDSLWIDQCFSR